MIFSVTWTCICLAKTNFRPQQGRGGGNLSLKAGQGGRGVTVSTKQRQNAFLSCFTSIIISITESPHALCHVYVFRGGWGRNETITSSHYPPFKFWLLKHFTSVLLLLCLAVRLQVWQLSEALGETSLKARYRHMLNLTCVTTALQSFVQFLTLSKFSPIV